MSHIHSRFVGAAAAIALLESAVFVAMPVAPAIAADSVLVGAGDVHANCVNTADVATAAVVARVSGIVFTLGDQVDHGTLQEYTDCYAQSWGAFKNWTIPVSGNHDWETAGAAGYFGYFGAAGGDPLTALYSYDIDDAWHVVVLNSECTIVAGGCGAGSPQDLWLQADLEAAAGRNVIAMWHKPPFASKTSRGWPNMRPLFATLHRYGVDLLLTAHVAAYERFAPQTADAIADPQHGVTEFIIGTGSSAGESFTTPSANSVIRKGGVSGVLKLTLHDDSYDWAFMPIAGKTFKDSGTALVNKGPTAPFGVDQDVLVKAGTPTSVTLHAIDLQKDPLTYSVVTPPGHGTLSGVEPDLTYTPYGGYLGDDMFTFRANDGTEDSAPLTVWLTVAAQKNVTVKDSAFSPKSTTQAQQATVRWSFTGPSAHSVQDSQSLGLFDSGSQAPGTTFSYAFSAAGTYSYQCSLHPSVANGTINIPLKVATTGAVGVPLTVTWASATLNGYRHDIQVLKPGSTAWSNWQTGTYFIRGDYTPALAGTYKFRARLTRISNGMSSTWSPVSSVSVN